MPLDHKPLPIAGFMGFYDRGEKVSTPMKHQSLLENFIFGGDKLKKRGGFVSIHRDNNRSFTRFSDILKGNVILQPRRIYSTGEFLFDGNNQLNTEAFTGATDFSALNMDNRYYITTHDRQIGKGGLVQVYNGNTLRPLAGEGPPEDYNNYGSGSYFYPQLIASGQFNNPFVPFNYLDIGRYIIAVSYQIENYITKPGYIRSFYVSDVETNRLQLNNIPPVSNSNVSAIIISMTRLFVSEEGEDDENTLTLNRKYARKFGDHKFYFVPFGKFNVEGGEIVGRDGNAIVGNLSFPHGIDDDEQAQLVNRQYIFLNGHQIFESSYLFDQKSSMPAALGLTEYSNRLIIWNQNRVYVSRANEPESFSDVDGFFDVGIEDPNTVKVCFAYRENLYILKDDSTYVVFDNGEAPNTWVPKNVDRGLGGQVHSVGRVKGFQGAEEDFIFIANKKGLCLFNGAYSEVEASWKIREYWKLIDNPVDLQTMVDATENKVYVFCRIRGVAQILTMDYQKGLAHQEISSFGRNAIVGGPRWSVIKKRGIPIRGIGYHSVADGSSTNDGLLILTNDGNRSEVLILRETEYNDDDFDQILGIDSRIQFSNLRDGKDLMHNHYGELRVRARGAGMLRLDGGPARNVASPDKHKVFKYILDRQGEDIDVLLIHDTINTNLEIAEFVPFIRPIAP